MRYLVVIPTLFILLSSCNKKSCELTDSCGPHPPWPPCKSAPIATQGLGTEKTISPLSPPPCPQPMCPEGFVRVKENSSVGTNADFCVMKFEARNNGLGKPISEFSGQPWVNLTIGEAREKCSALGAEYHLISNEEWMTIARSLEKNKSNWSNSEVETGLFARGWSSKNESIASYSPDTWTNSSVAPNINANEDSCLYNSGENQCGQDGDPSYKRRLTLSENDYDENDIWDLSGNVSEWVDWEITVPMIVYDSTIDYSTQPYFGDNCNPTSLAFSSCLGGPEKVLPLTSDPLSKGLGIFYGEVIYHGYAIRGGSWDTGHRAGIYGLGISSTKGPNIGFRCVYRSSLN